MYSQNNLASPKEGVPKIMKGQNIYYINNVYVCIYVIYIYICMYIYRESLYKDTIFLPRFW